MSLCVDRGLGCIVCFLLRNSVRESTWYVELTVDREITQQHIIYQGNLETILFFGGPIEVEWRIIKEQPILTFCIHYSAKHRKYATFRVKLYNISFFCVCVLFIVCQRPTAEFAFQGLIRYYCIALFVGCCFPGSFVESREHMHAGLQKPCAGTDEAVPV